MLVAGATASASGAAGGGGGLGSRSAALRRAQQGGGGGGGSQGRRPVRTTATTNATSPLASGQTTPAPAPTPHGSPALAVVGVTRAVTPSSAVAGAHASLTSADALELAGRADEQRTQASRLAALRDDAATERDRLAGRARAAHGEATLHGQRVAASERDIVNVTSRMAFLRGERGRLGLYGDGIRRARDAKGEERVGLLKKMSRAARRLNPWGTRKPEDVTSDELNDELTNIRGDVALIDAELAELAAVLPQIEAELGQHEANRDAALRIARDLDDEARGHASRVSTLSTQADDATHAATRLDGEAGEAEERHLAKVKAAAARKVKTSALEDQNVRGMPAARKPVHVAAMKRYGASSVIHAKPGEVAEDAVATAPEAKRFAIADGVTNSDFSGPFARILVRRWVHAPPTSKAAFNDWLADAQAEWDAETAPHIAELRKVYYNRTKAFVGHAAFVGAQLRERSNGKRVLTALALGDSALLQVRGGRLVAAFPLANAAQYSSDVTALPTKGKPKQAPSLHEIEVADGDEIFMVTDALAKWSLEEVAAGRDPFSTLRAAKSKSAFGPLVDKARGGTLPGHGTLDTDDTSMIHFTIPSGAP